MTKKKKIVITKITLVVPARHNYEAVFKLEKYYTRSGMIGITPTPIEIMLKNLDRYSFIPSVGLVLLCTREVSYFYSDRILICLENNPNPRVKNLIKVKRELYYSTGIKFHSTESKLKNCGQLLQLIEKRFIILK